MSKDIVFPIEFINEILQVLGEQPAKDVFSIILKIHQKVAEQQTEEKPKE